jgi:uncharacterized protein (TIGR02599 family)
MKIPAETRWTAFTLVEVLISTSIVVLVLLFMVSVTEQTAGLWRRSRAKVEQFREARTAYDTLTQRLGQATLNTYWDYDNPELPTRYQRRSELRFTCGQAAELLGPNGDHERITHCVFFHAPLGFSAVAPTFNATPASKDGQGYQGLENLLNCWGYLLEFGSDESLRPQFVNKAGIPPRWRFRLMEFALPAEKLATYNATSGGTSRSPNANSYSLTTWFSEPLRAALVDSSANAGTVHALAENIVALVLTPRLPRTEEQKLSPTTDDRSPLAPKYSYDSSPATGSTKKSDARYADARTNPVNQLPPIMQVTIVAIDEDSSIRLGFKRGDADFFRLKDKFQDTANFTKDLLASQTGGPGDLSLERELINRRVNYRIFTSNIPLRAAKWSRSQTEK